MDTYCGYDSIAVTTIPFASLTEVSWRVYIFNLGFLSRGKLIKTLLPAFDSLFFSPAIMFALEK